MCLSLMASCCEDEIVELAVPFINEHVKNQDWKFRDAAVMALGEAGAVASIEVVALSV